MRNRNRNIAVGLLLLAIAWAMMYAASQSSQGGKNSPLYSVYRYDPSGTAALREFFIARNIKVSLLERGRLRSSDHGVLFQVMPMNWTKTGIGLNVKWGREESHEVDPASLIDWVAQGNTVVQFTRYESSLIQALDAAQRISRSSATRAMTQPMIFPGSATQPAGGHLGSLVNKFIPQWDMPPESLLDYEAAENAGKFTDHGTHVRGKWFDKSAKPGEHATRAGEAIGTLELIGPGVDELSASSLWRPICVTENGVPLAFEQRFGQGRIVVIRSPTPALNRALAWSDNAAILLSLAGNGPVLFDEWSHNQPRDDSVMGMIYQVGLWPVLAQSVAALLVYVWSTLGYRRIDPPANNRRPSSRDQIRTLGYLYGRSLGPGTASTRVYTEVLSRVASAVRCSPSQVQARLAAVNPAAAQRLTRILADVAQAAQTEGPACLKCGYSLAGATGTDCPDCGTLIPQQTRVRIAATPVDVLSRTSADEKPRSRGIVGLFQKATGSQPHPSHLIDDILIRALTDSHHLALEITRDRRNTR